MVRKQNREDKIRRKIRNVPLRDFEALVNVYGYFKEGGNHRLAIIGTYTMSYPKESPIKACYVKDLLEIIDSL